MANASETHHPRLLVLAGPNGAGKSTLARSRFDELVTGNRFLNIDDIAADHARLGATASPVSAARHGLLQRLNLVAERRSFGIETTLAGQGILRFLTMATDRGYSIELFFLFLPDPILCHRRVAQRVALGGHDIPPETIDRRHAGGLKNLPAAFALAGRAAIFDASAEPRLIMEKGPSGLDVQDAMAWGAVKHMTIGAGSEPWR
jgi:predicted ABC-type ATPase